MIFLAFSSLAALAFMSIALQGQVNATANGISTSSSSSALTNSSVLPPPQPKGIVNVGVTPNQKAAGGATRGKVRRGRKKSTVVSKLHDSYRTHVYACAQFGGSFTGPNLVFAYASPVQYYSPIFGMTRAVNELYVLGGSWGSAIPKPSGQFVAKLNVGDLTQLWGTDLANLNATTSPTGVWNYIGGPQCACRWQPRSRRRQQLV